MTYYYGVEMNADGERAFIIRKDNSSEFYRVDFDRARTAAEKWDWLRHLAEKNWVTGDILRSLIIAFDRFVPSFEVTT